MEGGSSEGDKKVVESGENKVKRRMKTASQLQILEKAFLVESYPAEAVRAELSTQLGLTDRQLQMWFCHRRLKDRKVEKGPTGSGNGGKKAKKEEGTPTATLTMAAPFAGRTPPLPPPPIIPKDEMLGGEFVNEFGSGSGLGSSPYGHGDLRQGYVVRPGVAVPRLSGPGRHHETPQSVIDIRAIAFVEAQLGEPLRKDGPALGMEFDPLPPGAFGSPISSGVAQKPAGRAGETVLYDAKAVKHGSGRDLHEYQFLPEQPTVKSESYDRPSQAHYYGSPSDGLGIKMPPLPGVRTYLPGHEDVPVAYGHASQMPTLGLTSQQRNLGSTMPSTSGDYDNIPHKSPHMVMAMESPFVAHPILGPDNAPLPSNRPISQEDEVVRVERKRKSDEARMAKEIEAHEKKLRKELEKQDILRRKREEQMRKEIERQDRERRKEEERLMRERLREEERYQREQKREMERREKYMLQETQRAEKMRQKEELRREREVARQRTANNRAVARRLAKESMELIEDERLELMETAASKKGLPSIVSLDCETLENLYSFRDMLQAFPPKSVQLKKPFGVKPWLGSDENVGNLLMVWRFLITFADVLGLWPFTLDEFVQALHDYDPRLLGEIHVALLRTIIKDIEDVARTPSMGLGVNQNSVAAPSGGHPQIVEGAYTWGFDIRSWQRNLSPLTWPEITRQIALSAGFGPKLKKRHVEQSYSHEENEGDDANAVISNLRTGAAVENAVAILRERGYSNPRRSRHRLTPGTVKFAAYHVLSLEGGDGLNILEVADRIQKSGLRDLTTSKTPEASIAAALSRDSKLFERTAPSTYCVRSPFRKDPIDAEAILSTAREKIRVFKSGIIDGVEADVDGVEADDVEKDEDSDSDIAEDPEVDELAAEMTPSKDVDIMRDSSRYQVKNSDVGVSSMRTRAADKKSNGLQNTLDLSDNGCFAEGTVDVRGICQEVTNTDHGDTDIDESCPGELWVQGLMEGEYSILCVEERLNALASLIGLATEGNSVRIVLEERLEAATALKKQMWAEAQLDKRRMKEEYVMKTPYVAFAPNKTESTLTPDGRASVFALNENNGAMNANPQQTPFLVPLHDSNNQTPDFGLGSDNLAVQQSAYADRCRAQMKSYVGHKAEEMYVYRSLPLGQDRRRNRYWRFIASASCNDPGVGRIFVELYNGGWKLIDSEEAFDNLLASLDVRGVRESHLHVLLQKVEPLFKNSVRRKQIECCVDRQNDKFVKPEFVELASNRETGGATDSPSSTVCISNYETPELSSSFQIECGRSKFEMVNALKRYNEFEVWISAECFSSSVLRAIKYGKKRCFQLVCMCDSCHNVYFYENHHCPTCHKTYTSFDKNFKLSEHAAQCRDTKPNIDRNFHGLDSPPPRMRLLKAMLALVEVCIPPAALQSMWSDSYRKTWGMKLHSSSSPEELLNVLTLLEGAIKRDFLSPNYQTTSELLALDKNSVYVSHDAPNFDTVNVLPWIPETTSAVALRLMELDSAVAYLPDQKIESTKDAEVGQSLNLPSKYTVTRTIQEDELASPYGEYQQADAWVDQGFDRVSLGSTRGGRGRGRGRARGGRSQRRTVGSRGEPSRSLPSNEKLPPVVGGWKSRSSRGKGGRKRGRRSARTKQKPVKKAPAVSLPAPDPIFFDTPPGFSREEWNPEETRKMELDEDSISERSDHDDNNGEASGDEYDDMAIDNYNTVYNRNPSHSIGGLDFNVEGDEDDDDDRDEVEDGVDEDYVEGVDYEQDDMDVGGFFKPISDDDVNGDEDEDGERGGDQDDISDSASTDYTSSSE